MYALACLTDKSLDHLKVTFVLLYFQKIKLYPLEYWYNTHGLNCDFSWLEEIYDKRALYQNVHASVYFSYIHTCN